MPNNSEQHEQLKAESTKRFDLYFVNDVSGRAITVDLVQQCINKHKKGKAAGFDGITAEHMTLAHPVIVVQLTLLFNIIYTHSLLPDDFGRGIVIPLLKNPDGNQFTTDNYRGITLSPVIY